MGGEGLKERLAPREVGGGWPVIRCCSGRRQAQGQIPTFHPGRAGGWGLGRVRRGRKACSAKEPSRPHLLYLLPEMVLFPPLQTSSSNRDKT